MRAIAEVHVKRQGPRVDPAVTVRVEQVQPVAAIAGYHCPMVVGGPQDQYDGTPKVDMIPDGAHNLGWFQSELLIENPVTLDPKAHHILDLRYKTVKEAVPWIGVQTP